MQTLRRAAFFSSLLMLSMAHSADADDVLAAATAHVAAAQVAPKTWSGPTSGPKAAQGKKITLVENDASQGAAPFANALQAAATALGWQLTLFHGTTRQTLRITLEQAIINEPDGIITFGFDPDSAAAAMQAGAAAGVKFIGIESGNATMRTPKLPFFTRLGPSGAARAVLAADTAITFSEGHAGAIILTDARSRRDVHFARQMEARLRQCSACKVLAVVDVPRDAPVATVQRQLKALQQRYGSRWNVTLAPSDRYLRDFGSALHALGLKPPTWPAGIAAGEGSAAALKRIAAADGQRATVASPLALEAWQALDEINRDFANKDEPTGFAMPPLLVTDQNAHDPSLASGSYDPAVHYRSAYRAIWSR